MGETQTGFAAKLREFFIKKGRFKGSMSELARLSGVPASKLGFTIRDFVRRGELTMKNGEFLYVRKKKRELDVLDRVWRAFRYLPTWTINDIAAICEANKKTVKSYVRIYEKAGYIEKVSRPVINGVRQNIYRLKDKSIRERPKIFNQRKLKGLKNEGDKGR